MKSILIDEKYHFATMFDSETGLYLRTGVLDDKGNDTGEDPFQASFPHLIDVGIMGHCIHGKTGLCVKAGIGCYQSGLTRNDENMTVKDFEEIAKQCQGKVHQFALGGAGDPDQHEEFEEILKICRIYGIMPNFTTSGFGMTPQIAELCSKYCGAVAVSWYRSTYTLEAIKMLLVAGVKTNIHYVVSNKTIEEAIERLKNNDFPDGINAVIFLLHKPVGLGDRKDMLLPDDERVHEFFKLLGEDHPFKIGTDSCSIPGIINYSPAINLESLDTCEGGRFSCYIGADMTMTPCSFDQEKKYGVSLQRFSIEEAWNSKEFEQFRDHLRHSCPNCSYRESCMGGCPIVPEIVICKNKERRHI